MSELLLKDLLQYCAQRDMSAVELLEEERFREELLERVRERIPKRIEEISSSLQKQ